MQARVYPTKQDSQLLCHKRRNRRFLSPIPFLSGVAPLSIILCNVYFFSCPIIFRNKRNKKGKPPIWQLSALPFLLRYPYVGIIQIRFSVEGHTFLSACIQAPVCFIVFLRYRSIFIKEQGLFKIFLYSFYYISPIQVQPGAFPFFAYRETRPQRSRRPYIPRKLRRHSSAYHRWGTI